MRVERATFAFAHTRLAEVAMGRYAGGDSTSISFPTSVPFQLADLLQSALGSDYRLERELEAGGMSRLFLAKQVPLDRDVVVKVLPPELVSTQSIARFKREIDVTVRLQHPHILPILTTGAVEDVLYYITPFIPGESLRARLSREKKLPLDDILRILKDVCGALAFAHQRSIVHRDVKPGNILLTEGHAILADFGIARAVSTTATPLTESGVAPGTPAYMAPELPTDERADVYALGVVAYEMLCGQLPQRGVGLKQIIVDRGAVPGDGRRRLRHVAAVIVRAIAPLPTNRYQTARDFLLAISADRLPKNRSWSIAGLSTLAIVISVPAIRTKWIEGHLDDGLYTVAGFPGLGGSTFLSDTVCVAGQRRIVGALSEWREVRLSDVYPESAAGNPTTEQAWIQKASRWAREHRSRHLVAVRCAVSDGKIALSLALHDVGRDTMLKASRTVYSISDTQSAAMATRRLVNSLLRDGERLPWSSGSDSGSASLVEWRTIDEAQRALDHWDLEAADQAFSKVDSVDHSNLAVAVGLTKTLMLAVTTKSLDRFKAVSRHAYALRARMTDHDRLLVSAALDLADRRPADACRTFEELSRLAPNDAMAWVGRAECLRADASVVRDPRSPSGWSFRSSHEAALRAFEHVAELEYGVYEPGFRGWLVSRLSRLLPIETIRLRQGFAADRDTIQFAARPFLDHDTLAYVPYESSIAVTGHGDPDPALQVAAIARNLRLLTQAVEAWVLSAPAQPAPWALLADLTERTGSSSVIRNERIGALEALHRALRLTTDSLQRDALAIAEIRLLLEVGRFSEVRHSADSLLASAAPTRPATRSQLAGVAALVGRGDESAAFLATTQSFDINVPAIGFVSLRPPLAEVAHALMTYGAMGGPADSIRALNSRLRMTISSYITPPSKADAVGATISGRALSLAFPAAKEMFKQLQDVSEIEVSVAQKLSSGELEAARRDLEIWRMRSYGHLPGSTSADGTYRRALFAVTLGDTASSIAILDGLLSALPTIGSRFLDRPDQPAALVRAMKLRAQIAAAKNDLRTANLWGKSVQALWGEKTRN